ALPSEFAQSSASPRTASKLLQSSWPVRCTPKKRKRTKIKLNKSDATIQHPRLQTAHWRPALNNSPPVESTPPKTLEMRHESICDRTNRPVAGETQKTRTPEKNNSSGASQFLAMSTI